MPELPEIETIRRTLLPLPRAAVTEVLLSALAPVVHTTSATLRSALQGAHFTAVDRHGKYLLLRTDRPTTLVLHLGMTGRLLRAAPAHATTPHTHLELCFADDERLRYSDPRRFGTISLTHNPHGDDNALLRRLGPDYLDPALTRATFITRARRRPRLTCKALLLDQGIAAGMGNIYACEALYQAGIDPQRRINDCTDAALARLLTAALHVLMLGIAHGGTTLRDYVDGRGSRGAMQAFLQVYGREQQPTLDGRGHVQRMTQHGRSTWFAPEVQR